ncbi:hypothetical protein [Pantoea coffeiphila]|uniref:hypothetical protein n=1 Tax=Pantoea coffeiphila TaxID=1465635 RepID=UPI0019618EE4|nr:hypothetical protein [Pantoea coffeiphila]MBM7342159.1 hypothetical protein [Pantoea coffeiphila]
MSSKKWERFSPETIERLFTAVEEDDKLVESASLPTFIELRCSTDDIRHYYALCLQFWEDGFKREDLLKLINNVLQGNVLSEKERLQYKYIRARYKHLRFAQRLYSKKHESNFIFRQTTVFLGHFQDAFRNHNEKNIKIYGRLLNVILSAPVWSVVRYCLRHTVLDDDNGFIQYRQQQIRKLQEAIANPELTGDEFHDVRKIVSQQVSYYDTMRSLEPGNSDARQLSSFLSNINGLMGDRHDEMVADKLSGKRSYSESSQMANNIRQPIEMFVARYPL